MGNTVTEIDNRLYSVKMTASSSILILSLSVMILSITVPMQLLFKRLTENWAEAWEWYDGSWELEPESESEEQSAEIRLEQKLKSC